MKVGLVLSALCLVASIAFWAAVSLEGPSLPPLAPAAVSSPPKVEPPQGEAASSPVHALAAEGPADGALAADEEGEGELEETTELELPEEGQAVIRGRVGVSRGQLPESISVTLLSRAPQEEGEASDDLEEVTVEEGVADENGEFTFFVEPGSYRLVARAEGWIPSGVSELEVSVGEDVRDVLLELQPGRWLRGTVRAEGEPQSDVRVMAEGMGYRLSAWTDEQGRFEIQGLSPGTYRVAAFAEFLGGDEREAQDGSDVLLELGERERLEGRVVDADGRPAPGAAIYGVARLEGEDQPDLDPYGPLEGDTIGGLSSCGPSPQCREVGRSEEDGSFSIPVARGSRLLLAAGLGGKRSPVRELPWNAEGAVLALREPASVRIKVAGPDGRPSRGSVFVEPAGSEADFVRAVVQPDELGVATVPLWPGATLVLRGAAGAVLTAEARLPPGIRIAPSKRRPVVRLAELPAAAP